MSRRRAVDRCLPHASLPSGGSWGESEQRQRGGGSARQREQTKDGSGAGGRCSACKPTHSGAVRGPRVKDRVATEDDCAEACAELVDCIGYAYNGAPGSAAQTPAGVDDLRFRCFVYGAGLELALVPYSHPAGHAWEGVSLPSAPYGRVGKRAAAPFSTPSRCLLPPRLC